MPGILFFCCHGFGSRGGGNSGSPGSPGKASYLCYAESGGAFRYLGKGEKTAWATDRLYTILNRRWNEGLPTIITSNYGLARLVSMLTADEETAQAIASRVLGMCDGIEVGGEDRRRKNS